MREVTDDEIIAKILATNPWWRDRAKVPFTRFRARRYFYQFLGLAKSRTPNRALNLMGPRRVGKTVECPAKVMKIANDLPKLEIE